jgi:hypothetical protein
MGKKARRRREGNAFERFKADIEARGGRIWSDERGVHYEIPIPDGATEEDVAEFMEEAKRAGFVEGLG